MTVPPVIERLLRSCEPSIRYRTRVEVLGEDPDSAELQALRDEIRRSPRAWARALVEHVPPNAKKPLHPYRKWNGDHWLLVALADLCYPSGDTILKPKRDRVYSWLLSPARMRTFADGRRGTPTRICASIEGNALYSTLRLGVADERAEELAAILLRTQWPDGGWNCDMRSTGKQSSFMETLVPLRGLALYARVCGDPAAKAAAERAAEVFLRRRLFRRGDGSPIKPDFMRLHYPCYWRYDILFGLKVMAEAGFIADERCADALDVLESKRLPDGGFPAQGKFYNTEKKGFLAFSPVDWGPTGTGQTNEFVTVEALSVLATAGK